jgi:hypothetical protein
VNELRTVEVNRKNKWIQIDFSELVKGDIFRMFEPTSEEVIGNKGETVFQAFSNPYKNDDGIWQIDIVE